MYIKSCYGKFFETNKNIMLCKIMLLVYHVRRSLAVHITYYRYIYILIKTSFLYLHNVIWPNLLNRPTK